VYADPPYLISQATYNDGWDEESEKALLDKLKKLDSEGGRFALSNVLENKGKTNEILKNWVEENGYKTIHLDKSYANSYYHRKEKESKTDEVLIINY
jgi:adenine-specific DNA-methyltransferase